MIEIVLPKMDNAVVMHVYRHAKECWSSEVRKQSLGDGTLIFFEPDRIPHHQSVGDIEFTVKQMIFKHYSDKINRLKIETSVKSK